ncbi:S-layer protein [Methanoregula sp.]|uniref:COG1361 S-layer family protein n=1 Tax=Methanoregula sp. TaxID=2052170 RepID=UPI00236C3B6B|nr:S-layer protein [Methanoregula sp.]MDD1686769.1 S-layer protein [Methanoregula sp.]
MTVRENTTPPTPGNRLGLGCNILAFIILTGIAVALITVSPVSAGDGTQYLAGSPELSAAIDGSNELSPGKEVQLKVVIQNTGINQFKFVKSTIVNRDDIPSTAKFLTVSLGAGNTSMIVKSDPQMLGDLLASGKSTATFTVRVPSDATAGTYVLPVILNYTYLYTADQYGTDTIEYRYKSMNETLELPIKIKEDAQIDVISSDIQHLNAGTEGYITLKVKNVGHEDAKKAILVIAQNGKSPVIPTQGSAYIGDFPANGIATGIFRTSVDSSAEAQTYPLDVYVKYENTDGDTVSSDIETIGVPVGGKIEFEIISDPQTISPGQKKVITAKFKNAGDATAYQAVARISMVDPFSSNDDSAFLGDLAPGETKEASFLVTAESTATVKNYGIDSEVRYRDALDNSVISDSMKLDVTVVQGKSVTSVLTDNPALLAALAVLIIAIGGYLLYRRKKLQ